MFGIQIAGGKGEAAQWMADVTIFSLNNGPSKKPSLKSRLAVVPMDDEAIEAKSCSVADGLIRRMASENKWQRSGRLAVSNDFGIEVLILKC